MRDWTAQGRRIGRVHIVERPLTPYLEYEFATYRENIAAGEDVRIADRAADPRLVGLRGDFIGFDLDDPDRAEVVWFDYDEDGRILARHASHRDHDIDGAVAARNLALARSVPLDQFRTA